MKVTGPNSTSSVSGSKKRGRIGDGAGFSVETPQAQTGGIAGATPASALTSVDAILALQSVGDFTEAKRKATERAFSMLDVLDDLKLALLEGSIPRSKLVQLMDLVKSRRDETADARLEKILDEVETRAAVELAKLDA